MSHATAINQAIAAYLSATPTADQSAAIESAAGAVAAVVAAAKAAAQANKGMQSALFVGFLSLAAQGFTQQTIRATGAAIRRDVTRTMRVQSGFSAVRAKGTKESGAPDFSTASVYAGTVAAMLDAQRDNPTAWETAVHAIENAKDTAPAVHEDSGFFESISACKRTLAKYDELCAAEEAHKHPALMGKVDAPVVSMEALQAALTQTQAALTSALQGDASADLFRQQADMLAARIEERDAMIRQQDERILSLQGERDERIAEMAAARESAELIELRAIAQEAGRVFGKVGGDLLAELAGTESVADA